MADEPKPPFVKFEIRVEQDQNASIEAGHFVGRDVIFALVTPPGTKDRVEKKAEDWLANIEEGVKQERIPSFWLAAYRRAFEDYKESRETPLDGMPVKGWPVASPSQIATLLDINVLTVEQLSEANDETLNRVGMGGRALKEKARAWLDSANGKGKIAAELNALRTENKELKARDEQREKEIAELRTMVETLKKEDA